MATNLPDTTLRWELRIACREFNITTVGVLRNKLNATGALPAEDDTYSTTQIINAVFGDQASATLRQTLESTENVRLKNAALRAELLDRTEVTNAIENIVVVVRNVIESSNLTDQEKDDIMLNISSYPVVLENVADQQQLVKD